MMPSPTFFSRRCLALCWNHVGDNFTMVLVALKMLGFHVSVKGVSEKHYREQTIREIIVFHRLRHALPNPIWKQKQSPGQRANNSHVLEDEAGLLGDLEKVYRLIFFQVASREEKHDRKKKWDESEQISSLKPGTKIKWVVIKTWKVNKMNGCLNGDIKATTLEAWCNFWFSVI